MSVEHFFEVARERYSILLKRRAGEPRPWTDDLLFKSWKFTCVHREDDYTTTWFRENVRDRRSREPVAALMATVAFRWFNRPETGELLLPVLLGQDGWSPEEAWELLTSVPRDRKLFTAAYIIRSDFGEPKYRSIFKAIGRIYEERVVLASEIIASGSIERAVHHLSQFPLMGSFMAYEVASDLRWTCLLEHAIDIMTWAAPGPGAARGLGRVLYDNPGKFNYTTGAAGQAEMLGEMQKLLALSKSDKYWPSDRRWRSWEMREVEHWLCEYDKYVRAQLGQGRPKQRFIPRRSG